PPEASASAGTPIPTHALLFLTAPPTTDPYTFPTRRSSDLHAARPAADGDRGDRADAARRDHGDAVADLVADVQHGLGRRRHQCGTNERRHEQEDGAPAP